MGVPPVLDNVDVRLTRWMANNGVFLLRISLGLVFLWYGALKFIPGLSPAEELATNTISAMTLGRVPAELSFPVLATWECLIGLGLLFGRALRLTILLLMLQIVGAAAPLLLFPELTFQSWPFVPTLEGQYIVKNIVIMSAALVIGATVRGGRMNSEPDALVRSVTKLKARAR